MRTTTTTTTKGLRAAVWSGALAFTVSTARAVGRPALGSGIPGSSRALRELMKFSGGTPRRHGRYGKRNSRTTELLQEAEAITSRHVSNISFRFHPLEVNVSLQVHVESIEGSAHATRRNAATTSLVDTCIVHVPSSSRDIANSAADSSGKSARTLTLDVLGDQCTDYARTLYQNRNIGISAPLGAHRSAT
jgi:hypothetical protein